MRLANPVLKKLRQQGSLLQTTSFDDAFRFLEDQRKAWDGSGTPWILMPRKIWGFIPTGSVLCYQVLSEPIKSSEGRERIIIPGANTYLISVSPSMDVNPESQVRFPKGFSRRLARVPLVFPATKIHTLYFASEDQKLYNIKYMLRGGQ